MSVLSDYAYLDTRVSILAANLLSESDFENLANQNKGQHKTGNAHVDELLNDDSVKPAMIEQVLFTQLVEEFEVLLHPLSGAARELVLFAFKKYEITNLKTIVRGKMAKLRAEKIAEQLIPLGTFAQLPIEQLLRTEDISECLRYLENTVYARIARQSRQVFEEKNQLYALDAAIDRYYLLGFERRMNEIETAQRQHLLPLISTLMDIINLLWLLRYRFAYHLSPAETYYLLIPTKYHLNRTELQNLVELKTLPAVLAALPNPFQLLLQGLETTFKVECRLDEEIRRVARHTIRWHSFSVAKALAYLLLKELEINRILTIIKGKHLGLKLDNIQIAANCL